MDRMTQRQQREDARVETFELKWNIGDPPDLTDRQGTGRYSVVVFHPLPV